MNPNMMNDISYEVLECPTTQEAAEYRGVSIENQVPSMTKEELTQHVLKVMENSRCDKHGNMAHQDLICENGQITGHTTQLCKTLPCKKCGKCQDGRCEDWEMLGSISRLARQDIVKGLSTPILDRLLAVKADPGDGSLNH
ncbi:LOW QUALITY PROTEIN: hypothetical protein PHMEG_00015748 [Phytophthora megakarya]|uniref:Uncharacterized protein n=1 Tax=Phytophthora megakarya TaxID=4795 RepID=A0A225W1J0_9STRA|nr:LOW QUALITY PROTEIN: hypothetical protein PHMEG_00015748 [Phytophthora megakarya]